MRRDIFLFCDWMEVRRKFCMRKNAGKGEKPKTCIYPQLFVYVCVCVRVCE